MTDTDTEPPKRLQPPQLTIEQVHNRLALLFVGTACAIFGFFFIMIDASVPLIGKIGYPSIAFFLLIYYILFLDFMGYYVLKTLGIVISNYKKYKIWYLFFAILLLVVLIGGVAKYYATGNTYLEVFTDVGILVILAIVIEIIRPILSPKIDEFIKKFKEK